MPGLESSHSKFENMVSALKDKTKELANDIAHLKIDIADLRLENKILRYVYTKHSNDKHKIHENLKKISLIRHECEDLKQDVMNLRQDNMNLKSQLQEHQRERNEEMNLQQLYVKEGLKYVEPIALQMSRFQNLMEPMVMLLW